MSKMNPYDVLQIDSDADLATIKRAYRKLSRETHPDVAPAERHEEFRRATDAYQLLINPQRRKVFDETGDSEFDPSKEVEEINEIILSTFDKVVNFALNQGTDLKTVHFLDHMRDMIKDGINTIRGEYDQQKKLAEQLREVKSRVSREGEGENLFEAHLNAKIEIADTNSVMMSAAIRQMDAAVRELDSYKNDVDMTAALQKMKEEADAAAAMAENFAAQYPFSNATWTNKGSGGWS